VPEHRQAPPARARPASARSNHAAPAGHGAGGSRQPGDRCGGCMACRTAAPWLPLCMHGCSSAFPLLAPTSDVQGAPTRGGTAQTQGACHGRYGRQQPEAHARRSGSCVTSSGCRTLVRRGCTACRTPAPPRTRPHPHRTGQPPSPAAAPSARPVPRLPPRPGICAVQILYLRRAHECAAAAAVHQAPAAAPCAARPTPPASSSGRRPPSLAPRAAAARAAAHAAGGGVGARGAWRRAKRAPQTLWSRAPVAIVVTRPCRLCGHAPLSPLWSRAHLSPCGTPEARGEEHAARIVDHDGSLRAHLEGRVLEGRVLEGHVLEGRVLEGHVLEGHVLGGIVLWGRVLESRWREARPGLR
jgi:hypothetical protein